MAVISMGGVGAAAAAAAAWPPTPAQVGVVASFVLRECNWMRGHRNAHLVFPLHSFSQAYVFVFAHSQAEAAAAAAAAAVAAGGGGSAAAGAAGHTTAHLLARPSLDLTRSMNINIPVSA